MYGGTIKESLGHKDLYDKEELLKLDSYIQERQKARKAARAVEINGEKDDIASSNWSIV